jgi:F420-non-reducing hydrogenase large subunit
MRRVTVDPITRLEGHGRIEIFLNEQGDVDNAYLQVPELRGFERFCQGRPVEEMPRITERICGVCPEAHHMASSKACDAVYGTEITSAARKLRELFYSAHMIHSHIAHFYALAGPDFVVGPTAPKEKRNILGVIEKVGLEIGTEVIKHRAYAQRIQEMIGGKATHPVCGIPGGMSKALTEEEREEIEGMAQSSVEFGKASLQIFDDVVLKNSDYVDLILSDSYTLKTHYMGLVDENNQVNFYDGKIRVVDPDGQEVAKVECKDYLDIIDEHVEPWTYLKFPYLKSVGWKGLVDGKESGVYRVAPLARLNAADGMATPVAQEAYEKFFSTLGGRPVHATLAMNWARLVELMYATEHMYNLSRDPEITSRDVRAPLGTPREGVGVVEAPRGTLFHHYWTDGDGLIMKANLIVATGNNNAGMCMSVKKAAQGVISGGKVDEGLLNMVEMAYRAYDPCIACATHWLPGEMPLEINIYDHQNRLAQQLKRNL